MSAAFQELEELLRLSSACDAEATQQLTNSSQFEEVRRDIAARAPSSGKSEAK